MKIRTFEFKKLEIKDERSWISKALQSPHYRKTVLYATLGAIIGYLLFLFGEGSHLGIYWNDEAIQNIVMGVFFGIFLTNSPCAKGRC